MTTPDEFNKKLPISIGLVVFCCAISFSLGTLYTKIFDQGEELQEVRNFVEQEVGGLRADWERDRQMQNKRLEKLEDDK